MPWTRPPSNKHGVRHGIEHDGSQLVFSSRWQYPGYGDRQQLLVRIEKTADGSTEIWEDKHPMVAISFSQLQELLAPLFTVHVFEHVHDRIEPRTGTTGNAIFVAVRK